MRMLLPILFASAAYAKCGGNEAPCLKCDDLQQAAKVNCENSAVAGTEQVCTWTASGCSMAGETNCALFAKGACICTGLSGGGVIFDDMCSF